MVAVETMTTATHQRDVFTERMEIDASIPLVEVATATHVVCLKDG